MIALDCGCGASLALPATMAGHEGRCPSCGHWLRVPLPPEPPAPPPPPARRFEIARVTCACGREVPAPRRLLATGNARCPSCDARLTP